METSHLLQRDMHFAMCTYMISLYRKSLHTLRFISDRCRCGIAARGPGLSRSLQQTLLFQVMLFFDPFRSPYISVLWRHLVGREAEKLWSCSKTGWNVVSLSIFCWIFSVGLTHGSEKEHRWCAACELQTSLNQHASLNKYNVNSVRSWRTWTNEKVRIARTIFTLRPVNV